MSILWELYKGKDFDVKPTLERIRKACEYLGNPQNKYPSILVGGTNGKGSTCAFTESILRKHGLKTGWFVSPHLISENERWRINAKEISEEKLKYYVKELKPLFEKFELTYFEAATLIAVRYFADEEVDVAVFEVGMGGRWDATKVSNPTVVAITNVERDHTRWLGKNVYEIAEDKLHLYRKGIPLVIGSARFPLYAKAIEMNIKDTIVAGLDYEYYGKVEREQMLLLNYSYRDISFSNLKLSLFGKWQIDNAANALTISREFLGNLNEEKVREALKTTKWEGRMEILRSKPLLMVDASHNPYAVAKVIKEVRKHFPEIKIAFSSLAGKEWQLSLEIISKYFNEVFIIPIDYYRAENPQNLVDFSKKLGLKAKIIYPEEAVNLQQNLLILGSIYLISDIKRTYNRYYKAMV